MGSVEQGRVQIFYKILLVLVFLSIPDLKADIQSVDATREELLIYLPSWKAASFRKDPYSWQDQIVDFASDEAFAAGSTLGFMVTSYFSHDLLKTYFGPFFGHYGSLVSDIAVDGITTSSWPDLLGRMAVTTGAWAMSDKLHPAATVLIRYLFSHWQLLSTTLPDIWQSLLPQLKGQQILLCGHEELCRAVLVRYRLPGREFAPDTGKPWLEISFPFGSQDFKPESNYEKTLIDLRTWAREQGVTEIHLYPDSENDHRKLWVRAWANSSPGNLFEFPAHFSTGAQTNWWTDVLAEKKPEQRTRARKLINPLHSDVITNLPAVLSGAMAGVVQVQAEEHFVSGGKNLMAVSSGKDSFILFDRYISQGYELPEVWLISSLPLSHVMKQVLRSLDIRRPPPPWRGGWKLASEVVRSSVYRAIFDWVIAQLKTDLSQEQKQEQEEEKEKKVKKVRKIKKAKKAKKKTPRYGKSRVKQKVVPLYELEEDDDMTDREDVLAPEDLLPEDEPDESRSASEEKEKKKRSSKRKVKLDFFSLEPMEKRLRKVENIQKELSALDKDKAEGKAKPVSRIKPSKKIRSSEPKKGKSSKKERRSKAGSSSESEDVVTPKKRRGSKKSQGLKPEKDKSSKKARRSKTDSSSEPEDVVTPKKRRSSKKTQSPEPVIRPKKSKSSKTTGSSRRTEASKKTKSSQKVSKKVKFSLPEPDTAADEQNVLVLGKSGSGKSTMIRWIADDLADSLVAEKDKDSVTRYQGITIDGVEVYFSEVSVSAQELGEAGLPERIVREMGNADKIIWCGDISDERYADRVDSNHPIFSKLLERACVDEKPVYVALTHGNEIVPENQEEASQLPYREDLEKQRVRREFLSASAIYHEVRNKQKAELVRELEREKAQAREELKLIDHEERWEGRGKQAAQLSIIENREKLNQILKKQPKATLTDMFIGLTGMYQDGRDMLFPFLTSKTESAAQALEDRIKERAQKARKHKRKHKDQQDAEVTNWLEWWRVLVTRDDAAQRSRATGALDSRIQQVRAGARGEWEKIWKEKNR